MTQDEFEEAYDMMVDAAYDGLLVSVALLATGKHKLGVVAMEVPDYALPLAESENDNVRLAFGARMIIQAVDVANKMASQGLEAFDGTAED